MSYLDAAYFTVVSFSTIGYGDIFPVLWVEMIFLYLVYENGIGFYSVYQSYDH